MDYKDKYLKYKKHYKKLLTKFNYQKNHQFKIGDPVFVTGNIIVSSSPYTFNSVNPIYTYAVNKSGNIIKIEEPSELNGNKRLYTIKFTMSRQNDLYGLSVKEYKIRLDIVQYKFLKNRFNVGERVIVNKLGNKEKGIIIEDNSIEKVNGRYLVKLDNNSLINNKIYVYESDLTLGYI